MRLAIAGGGTGGHLFPGVALAEEHLARHPENTVLFLGAKGGLEETALPALGHRVELLPSLKGGFFGLDFPKKIARFGRGYMQARRALLAFQADALIGMGGYASVAPALAAWGIEIPVVLMEQNAIPGQATRRLARFAHLIGGQFPEAKNLVSTPNKYFQLGNPLRKNVLQAAEQAAAKNLEKKECPANPTLLVLGGSQGAKFLNNAVIQAWPRLSKTIPGLRVLLVAGRDDAPRATEAFAAAGVRGEVLPFCNKMEELYAQADLALARAGATTLAELSSFALPSILVPYPHAADDHQNANARSYRMAHAAWVLDQRHLEPERLAQRVADTLLQPERRRRMAQSAYNLARVNAAKDVLARVEELLKKSAAPAGTPAPQPA